MKGIVSIVCVMLALVAGFTVLSADECYAQQCNVQSNSALSSASSAAALQNQALQLQIAQLQAAASQPRAVTSSATASAGALSVPQPTANLQALALLQALQANSQLSAAPVVSSGGSSRSVAISRTGNRLASLRAAFAPPSRSVSRSISISR